MSNVIKITNRKNELLEQCTFQLKQFSVFIKILTIVDAHNFSIRINESEFLKTHVNQGAANIESLITDIKKELE